MLILKDSHRKPIQFELNRFPDGQQQLKIKSEDAPKVQVILASIPNPEALDLFLQAYFTLKKYHPEVRINYFYGARSDKDVAGGYIINNTASYMQNLITGLSDVTIRTIDHQIVYEGYSPEISILAPHCDLGKFGLGKPFWADYYLDRYKEFNQKHISEYDLVVFPDESSIKRFSHILQYCKEYVVCEKHRDQETGQIVSHRVPDFLEDVPRMLVLDDLADGCKSFLNLGIPSETKADIFIFHGVFSNNALPKLLAVYNKVIVTNSLSAPEEQQALLSIEDQKRVTILNVW